MVQWYNPLMPYRYLNPRMSGMIAYKGGGSGASAEQVDASVQAGTDAVNANTDAGFAAAAETGAVITGNQDTMLNNQANLQSGQQDIRNDIANIPQTTVVSQTVDTSGIENRIGSLEGTTNTGFANVQSGLNEVQSDVRNVGQSVDTGFANVGNQFNDLNTAVTDTGNKVTDLQNNVGEQFSDLNNNLYGGFAVTNENIDQNFAAQNDNLNTQFTNVLGGQSNINTLLDQIGQRQDTYYGGLAQGQADILGNVGGLQNTFNDYQKSYNDNTTLERQAQADLQSSVASGFKQVGANAAATADSAARDMAQIQAAVAQQGTAQQQQADQTARFGQTLREISANAPVQTQEQAASRDDILSRLDAVRFVLETQGKNINPDVADQYSKLASSFDEQGRLIRQSIDDQGNLTQRTLNAQDTLLMATFNRTGQLLNQDSLNINQLFAAMDRLGYTGAGQTSGALSPQILVNRPAAVQNGIMSQTTPFFQTYG